MTCCSALRAETVEQWVELTKNSSANPQLWQKLCNHLNKARFRFLKEVTEEEQASITPYIITMKFYHISLFSHKQFPHLKILLTKYICVNVNAHECRHECRWHGVGGSDLLELEYCTVILSCLMWASKSIRHLSGLHNTWMVLLCSPGESWTQYHCLSFPSVKITGMHDWTKI